MKSIHRKLRLSHHKHTGKIIHHKHTSYGALVGLMMIPIVVFSMIGHMVLADSDIQVSATVPQAPPPFAPKITSPTDGGRFATDPEIVSGTCPLANPAIYISIVEGSNIIGTTTCSNATGTFALPLSFSYGSHTIYAQVVTFTDALGLASDPITITRYFSVVSSGGTSSGSKSIQSAKVPVVNPVLIVSGQGVVPFGPQMDAVWRGTISGGTAPYKVHVIWGDGKTDDYTVYSQSQQTFTHHFTVDGSYTMTFQVTDSAGNSTSLRVIAASALPPAAPLLTDSTNTPTWYWRFMTSDIVKAYGSVFFILICVWWFKRRHDKKEDEKHHPAPPRPFRPAHV